MGKCKKKSIQADLGIFAHIPADSHIWHDETHSVVIQAYLCHI